VLDRRAEDASRIALECDETACRPTVSTRPEESLSRLTTRRVVVSTPAGRATQVRRTAPRRPLLAPTRCALQRAGQSSPVAAEQVGAVSPRTGRRTMSLSRPATAQSLAWICMCVLKYHAAPPRSASAATAAVGDRRCHQQRAGSPIPARQAATGSGLTASRGASKRSLSPTVAHRQAAAPGGSASQHLTP